MLPVDQGAIKCSVLALRNTGESFTVRLLLLFRNKGVPGPFCTCWVLCMLPEDVAELQRA